MACDALPDEVRDAVAARRLVPLVGPLVSKLADPSIPDWVELLESLLGAAAEYAPEGVLDRVGRFREKGDFRRAASLVLRECPTEVYLDIFERSFGHRRAPTPAHEDLVRLRAPLVMTTNFDALIETAVVIESGTSPVVLTHRKAEAVSSLLSSSIPTVLKLFGTADDPFGIVFGEESFSDATFPLEMALRQVFADTTVLAIGFPPDDPAASTLFQVAPRYGRHFVVFPRSVDAEARSRWHDEYGFEPVVCDDDDSAISGLLATLSALVD